MRASRVDVHAGHPSTNEFEGPEQMEAIVLVTGGVKMPDLVYARKRVEKLPDFCGERLPFSGKTRNNTKTVGSASHKKLFRLPY